MNALERGRLKYGLHNGGVKHVYIKIKEPGGPWIVTCGLRQNSEQEAYHSETRGYVCGACGDGIAPPPAGMR